MIQVSRKSAALVGVISGVALALAGCSSPGSDDQAETNSGTQETPAPQASEPAVDEGTVVMVSEAEFSITLSQETFTAGTYTFKVTDDGSVPHNLNIIGPGVDTATDSMVSGGSASLTVTLEPGTYELFCAVGNHRMNGMDETITVT